jgi:hypothetical protein
MPLNVEIIGKLLSGEGGVVQEIRTSSTVQDGRVNLLIVRANMGRVTA